MLQDLFIYLFIITRGSFSPVRVNCKYGAAAWLSVTLVMPSVQGAGTQTD